MQIWHGYCILQFMSLFTIKIENLHVRQNDELLHLIIKNQKKIMATQEELATQLLALKEQTDKANAELVQKIADLEAAIVAAGNTTPAVDDALAALKASVKAVDDIVPDPA